MGFQKAVFSDKLFSAFLIMEKKSALKGQNQLFLQKGGLKQRIKEKWDTLEP